MSSFTQKERDEEEARRKAANLARDVPLRGHVEVGPPKAQCIHCQRVFGISEGHMGEVSVCDRCLGR